jgi:protein ATS1
MAAVYAIGSNGSGQLGIGHKEDVSVPKEVIFEDKLSGQGPPLIRAGGNHTLLLSSTGDLYCSGDYSAGACGLMRSDTVLPVFRKILLGFPDEATGDTVLCASTWEASVYSFGTGNKGELGLGELIFRSPKAQLIKDFPPQNTEVVDLAASVSHVVAVLSNGEVYGWGNGRKGQLGAPDGIIYSPRKILDLNFAVARAVCGREFTYLIGESGDGKHIVLGSNKFNTRSSAPANVSGWQDVGASWGGILVLLSDGKILSWGRDDHGQLAPPSLPELSLLAVGSEHVVALSKAGDVLAWGWGEHGNCGPSTMDGDVKGKWNVVASSKYLPTESKIVYVAGGCATSWVCIGSV